jgi:LCP family protein required for cell wall assembly
MPRSRLFRLFLAAALALLLTTVPSLLSQRPSTSQPSGSEQPPAPTDPANAEVMPLPLHLLVIGLDASLKRSDVLLAISVPQQGQISVLSIPRDTRVPMPSGPHRKINELYALGGTQATQEGVSRLLGTDFPYYLTLCFRGFEQLVDALGGVSLLVKQRLHYVDHAGGLCIDIQPGHQTLTGAKALEFVRYRADGRGDIGRIQRQHDFMREWARSIVANPERLLALRHDLPQGVQTNLPTADSVRLAMRLATDQRPLHFGVLPGEPAYLDQVSYWLPHPAQHP